jgi:hypothetical protein
MKKKVLQPRHQEKVNAVYFGASGSFVHGFVATLSVILVSELGDKTFFIGEKRNDDRKARSFSIFLFFRVII